MHTLNTQCAAPTAVANIATMSESVVMLLDDGSCLLDNGRRATRATSCLIEPRAGDCVLLAQTSRSAQLCIAYT